LIVPNSQHSALGVASRNKRRVRNGEAGFVPVQAAELKLFSKALGPEHPDTLTSMANLAHILYSQGNIHKAFVLKEDCVRLRGKLLGHSHPHTRNSARSLKPGKKWPNSLIIKAELQSKQDRLGLQGTLRSIVARSIK
jgi:hypothetical protein